MELNPGGHLEQLKVVAGCLTNAGWVSGLAFTADPPKRLEIGLTPKGKRAFRLLYSLLEDGKPLPRSVRDEIIPKDVTPEQIEALKMLIVAARLSEASPSYLPHDGVKHCWAYGYNIGGPCWGKVEPTVTCERLRFACCGHFPRTPGTNVPYRTEEQYERTLRYWREKDRENARYAHHTDPGVFVVHEEMEPETKSAVFKRVDVTGPVHLVNPRVYWWAELRQLRTVRP
jgi:hypothetical protein